MDMHSWLLGNLLYPQMISRAIESIFWVVSPSLEKKKKTGGLEGAAPRSKWVYSFSHQLHGTFNTKFGKNCWLINYTILCIIATVTMMFNPCHMLSARHFLSCMQHAKRLPGNGLYSIAVPFAHKIRARTYVAWESGGCSHGWTKSRC